MTDNRKRQPKGITTGGRFAATLRDEPDVSLAPEETSGAEAVEAGPAPEVPLAEALAGYRLNRVAARTSLDAYDEAVATPGVSPSPRAQQERLAERRHSIDLAVLCMHTSLRALRPRLNQEERVWADRIAEAVADPDMSVESKSDRLHSTIRTINVGRLEDEVLRERALNPDEIVMGSRRRDAARYTRQELAQAEAAYEAAGGGWIGDDHPARIRVVRARKAAAHYSEYTD